MSAGTKSPEDTWRVPPAEGKVSNDGERYSLYWWPRQGTTRRALFRIVTDDNVAVLLHVASWSTRQRGAARSEYTDDPTLDDIPLALLGVMKEQGFTPADSAKEAEA